jgi:hypothetical protein
MSSLNGKTGLQISLSPKSLADRTNLLPHAIAHSQDRPFDPSHHSWINGDHHYQPHRGYHAATQVYWCAEWTVLSQQRDPRAPLRHPPQDLDQDHY